MMKDLKTTAEADVVTGLADAFESGAAPLDVRLANFPKYVRRQDLKRFLVRYELLREALDVKGSIIECGVHQGFGLLTWLQLSAILEPENLTRRIIGFDTFGGFPEIGEQDHGGSDDIQVGDLAADCEEELHELIALHDQNRFLGHIEKVRIVRGDASKTMPGYIEDHPETIVSVLFLDFDLYEPTKVALETFLPRMPGGAILAFDELDNPRWPGETLAALHSVGLRNLKLRRLPWDPYVAFASI